MSHEQQIEEFSDEDSFEEVLHFVRAEYKRWLTSIHGITDMCLNYPEMDEETRNKMMTFILGKATYLLQQMEEVDRFCNKKLENRES